MKPSWETVEYARMRLMSVCATAMLAAKRAVITPVHVITLRAAETDFFGGCAAGASVVAAAAGFAFSVCTCDCVGADVWLDVTAVCRITTGGGGSIADIRGYVRATRKTPAATIVAAWISALTGVGPSIASGNHTGKGPWPDFPTAPQKISSAMPVEAAIPMLVV